MGTREQEVKVSRMLKWTIAIGLIACVFSIPISKAQSQGEDKPDAVNAVNIEDIAQAGPNQAGPTAIKAEAVNIQANAGEPAANPPTTLIEKKAEPKLTRSRHRSTSSKKNR